MKKRMPYSSCVFVLVMAFVGTSVAALAQVGTGGASGTAASPVEQLSSGSRTPYVHRITLYDHDGIIIRPTDMNAKPYSPATTCGKCHPVGLIGGGWHFGGHFGDGEAGGRGEPWVFTRAAMVIALPLSDRPQDAVFTLDDIDMSRWEFVKEFGRHLPGGGIGLPDRDQLRRSKEAARWGISGRLEIDCMFCHAAGGGYDPAEAERQIARENIHWAPTAAMGLAAVRGDARKVPDDFDPYAPPNPDFPEQALPKVIYDRSLFDPDNRVLFDVTRRPSIDRCYFCHTARIWPDPEVPERMAGRALCRQVRCWMFTWRQAWSARTATATASITTSRGAMPRSPECVSLIPLRTRVSVVTWEKPLDPRVTLRTQHECRKACTARLVRSIEVCPRCTLRF